MQFGKKEIPYKRRSNYYTYTTSETQGTSSVIISGSSTPTGNFIPYNTYENNCYTVLADFFLQNTSATTVNAKQKILVGNTETNSGTTAGGTYYNDTTLYPSYVASKFAKFRDMHCLNLNVRGNFSYEGSFIPTTIETTDIDCENVNATNKVEASKLVASNTSQHPAAEISNGYTSTYNYSEGLHTSGTTYLGLDESRLVTSTTDTRTDSQGNPATNSAEAIPTTSYIASIVPVAIDVTPIFTGDTMEGCLHDWMNAPLYAAKDWGDGYVAIRKVICTEIGYNSINNQARLIALGQTLDYTTSCTIQSTGGVFSKGIINKVI